MANTLGKTLQNLPGPVLITGHTGFKGTWMTFLLEKLNVPVVGFSLPATKDSLFNRTNRVGAIPEIFEDVRNYDALEEFLERYKPSTIIHMAAQPLVLESYKKPRETFEVNVMGTVNILDLAFRNNYAKAVTIITTDKVYRNHNSKRAFIETDPLEGSDPYSASKVGAEAVVTAWQQIAKVSDGPKVVSVRAGNVIGGGDLAMNRLMPDIIRHLFFGEHLEIRNPKNTRPWQHVLDPLAGYINLTEKVINGLVIRGMNFGPNEPSLSVNQVCKIVFADKQITLSHQVDSTLGKNYETDHLELSNLAALEKISWSPNWNQEESIVRTINWWRNVLLDQKDATSEVIREINEYFS